MKSTLFFTVVLLTTLSIAHFSCSKSMNPELLQLNVKQTTDFSIPSQCGHTSFVDAVKRYYREKCIDLFTYHSFSDFSVNVDDSLATMVACCDRNRSELGANIRRHFFLVAFRDDQYWIDFVKSKSSTKSTAIALAAPKESTSKSLVIVPEAARTLKVHDLFAPAATVANYERSKADLAPNIRASFFLNPARGDLSWIDGIDNKSLMKSISIPAAVSEECVSKAITIAPEAARTLKVSESFDSLAYDAHQHNAVLNAWPKMGNFEPAAVSSVATSEDFFYRKTRAKIYCKNSPHQIDFYQYKFFVPRVVPSTGELRRFTLKAVASAQGAPRAMKIHGLFDSLAYAYRRQVAGVDSSKLGKLGSGCVGVWVKSANLSDATNYAKTYSKDTAKLCLASGTKVLPTAARYLSGKTLPVVVGAGVATCLSAYGAQVAYGYMHSLKSKEPSSTESTFLQGSRRLPYTSYGFLKTHPKSVGTVAAAVALGALAWNYRDVIFSGPKAPEDASPQKHGVSPSSADDASVDRQK